MTVSMSDSMNPALQDLFRRPMQDLRISVTDRCNLRCTYCMPADVFDSGYAFLPRTELLSLEEIERVARLFARAGVRKIRLTGGEPLLRRGIEKLVEKLAKIRTTTGEPIEVAMTSNGVLLPAKAQSLKDAGLQRITVSLDALDERIFALMSGAKVPVSAVLDGIAAVCRAGLAPIKVNMVVKRGVNESQILPMAEYFRNSGIVLRFIEYMDAGNSNGWNENEVFSSGEVLDTLCERYALMSLSPNVEGEVASRWAYEDGAGEIGLISSVTQVFCNTCTRIRLSTDGKLYTCLFAEKFAADIKSLIRRGDDDASIAREIASCWQSRRDQYSLMRHEFRALSREKIEMSYIGG